MKIGKTIEAGWIMPTLPALEPTRELNFWSQCQRSYTFQPIYCTSGVPLAIELLTAVYHPDNPDCRLSPEDYFEQISQVLREDVVLEQLRLIQHWHSFIQQRDLLVSVNVDGQTLQSIQLLPEARKLLESMPYLRFEMVEHAYAALTIPIQSLEDVHRLWLDDFGSGLANFSSLMECRYEFVKLDRALFSFLRESHEGVRLFYALVALMSRYTKGVIVEGVETPQEWMLVKRSEACAAQGFYLSRPNRFDSLHQLPTFFRE